MNRISSFFKGRGLYWTLSLCIVVAAACSFFAVKNIVTKQMNTNNTTNQQGGADQWDLPGAQVENKVEDVPVQPTATPKTSAKPSASSASSSAASIAPTQSPALDEPADASVQYFAWPVDGQILQDYSGDELVYNETLKDWRTHNGIDIACEAGTEVKSAKEGTVTNVYENGIWGQTVEIDDGTVIWRYCGLDANSIMVAVDDQVLMGDVIAKVGEISAEQVAESHLHLEVLKDGVYQDPNIYLS